MSYEDASRAFGSDVREEAERQVMRGVPPWDAVIKAREIVSVRRRRKTPSVNDPLEIER